jgi:hypothetical protein
VRSVLPRIERPLIASPSANLGAEMKVRSSRQLSWQVNLGEGSLCPRCCRSIIENSACCLNGWSGEVVLQKPTKAGVDKTWGSCGASAVALLHK